MIQVFGVMLTVAKGMRQLPNETIYLGDIARCPYGPRPGEEVKNSQRN